ncbi:hypothetical protein Cni_G05068 [Canna indica]|uniref:Uncharacterized protein n=1 Tax=Canna indica TaxID=4628 RepID=A0AAQ3JUL1_9LILI|nr:hypothetical protein Cni_G05068 [Canna indica]
MQTYDNAIEIKVVYVRIISSATMPSTMAVAFPSCEGAEDSLTVNGKAAVTPLVLLLRRNSANTASGESVYLSTDSVRFSGGCLGFELRVWDECSTIVVGMVQRKGGGVWVMRCKFKDRGGSGEESGVEGGNGMVDVYFVGRSMGRAMVLSRVVQMRKMCGRVAIEDCKELVKGIFMREQSCEGLMKSYYIKDGEGKRSVEEEVGEVSSWFSAGVRVGIGLGLGMCLGVGVGVSLMMRSYQVAAGAFRKFI